MGRMGLVPTVLWGRKKERSCRPALAIFQYLSEVIVSGRALTPRSIVVRITYNSEDWLSFNISIIFSGRA
jgi:hypothetical protein